MTIRKVRYFIFLRDVFVLSVTAFGGPQAHMAHFLNILVRKRRYLDEKELLELQALCQILPGPTSTQTITAVGFKIGGPNLAYLTLLTWMVPAVTVMTLAGLLINSFAAKEMDLSFARFIQPTAIGIIAYSAYIITSKVVSTKTGYIIMALSAIGAFFIRSPFLFPLMLLAGGLITSAKYKAQPKEDKDKLKIEWSNFILWGVVLIFAASLGGITKFLPVKLFENFYRNGSLIFGGGQVLIPMLFTEFVEFKNYLSAEEFLSGYGLVQALPGPVFSFSAYLGAVSSSDLGFGNQILSALLASAGIFLPGTFFIFFVIRFWEGLKKYRIVKASLEGIHAVSSGLIVSAVFLLSESLEFNILNSTIIVVSFLVLIFTKVPMPLLIFLGLALGIIIK